MKINKTTLLLTCLGLTALFLSELLTKPKYIMVGFNERKNKAIHYALSKDGLNWEMLDKSISIDSAMDDMSVMHTPYITRDPNRGFHIAYRSEEHSRTLVFAFSKDLIDFDHKKNISAIENVDWMLDVNTPKLIYDEDKKEWLMYWASTNAGEFKPMNKQNAKNKHQKVYAVTTKDFHTFSEPFLVFDPGYAIIDPTIIKHNNRFVMFFKENSSMLGKRLMYASAKSIYGFWEIHPHILSESCTKILSASLIDKSIFLYYLNHNSKQTQIKRSVNLTHWEDISNDGHFPENLMHGSVLKLSRKEVNRLRTYLSKN